MTSEFKLWHIAKYITETMINEMKIPDNAKQIAFLIALPLVMEMLVEKYNPNKKCHRCGIIREVAYIDKDNNYCKFCNPFKCANSLCKKDAKIEFECNMKFCSSECYNHYKY